MYLPTPSTGIKRPNGAPVPEPNDDKRAELCYGQKTPKDQAKHAYSTQQNEDKALRLTAEFTYMRLKYKAALRQALPDGIIRTAEATNLGPSTANC